MQCLNYFDLAFFFFCLNNYTRINLKMRQTSRTVFNVSKKGNESSKTKISSKIEGRGWR